MKTTCPRPEPLESRIAPAVFFLSGTANTVVDSGGTDVNNVSVAGDVGASVAVKLAKGDSLALDTNGNHILDAGEVTYAKVTGGSAIVFATDLNATAGFTPGELTGLAVSTGFKATITGDVRGDIATVLNPAGAFSPTVLEHGSIASLKVTGVVTGSILAGTTISNVNIGSGTMDTDYSVQTIATGLAADGRSISFSDGGVTNNPVFTATNGEKGGDIKNVTLAHGAALVKAGKGGDNFGSKPGGAGGNIVNLTFLDTKDTFLIYGGEGGGADEGKGGNGGSIIGLKITGSADFSDTSYAQAGDGGFGKTGGAGGASKNITIEFTADSDEYVYCYGGDGGNGGESKSVHGGNGGAVSNFTFNSTANIEFVAVYAGDGGDTNNTTTGKGGNGGKITKVAYSALGGTYGVYLGGGDGGDGSGTGAGGIGGDLANIKADTGDTTSNSDIYGGNGGDGGSAGKGGRGGNVVNFDHTCKVDPGNETTSYLWVFGGDGGNGGKGGGRGGDSKNGKMTGGDGSTGFYIYGGEGGDGTGNNAKGGNGGNIMNVVVDVGASNSESQFFAGDGGNGNNANAGNGGAIVNMKMNQNGNISNLFQFSTGEGGDVTSGNGKGGNGGAFTNSSFTKKGGPGLPNTGELSIFTGRGGNGHGTGNGGNGGAMTGFQLDLQTAIDFMNFFTGDGGEAGATAKKGGNGGAMTQTKLSVADDFGSLPLIYGGNGGRAAGPNGKGGDSGSINGMTVLAMDVDLFIGGDVQGGDGGAKGGNGGVISKLTGKFGTLSILASRGGDSDTVGGDGGSIVGLNASEVTDFVRLIEAGDGGDGGTKAGAGGSVIKAKVNGDIGDFASNFNVSFVAGAMGGLIAGQAGSVGGIVDAAKNGSILGVNAARIAAILAGSPAANALTADNAVAKIAGLVGVTAIGADIVPAGFSFNDNAGGPNPGNGIFLLGDGDTAIDGLVIVKTGGFTSPHPTPLKLIEV